MRMKFIKESIYITKEQNIILNWNQIIMHDATMLLTMINGKICNATSERNQQCIDSSKELL